MPRGSRCILEQPGSSTRGTVAEAVGAAAQRPPATVERILLVAAAVQGVVLDTGADVTEGVEGELAHVEGIIPTSG